MYRQYEGKEKGLIAYKSFVLKHLVTENCKEQ